MSKKEIVFITLASLLFTMSAIAQTDNNAQPAPERTTGISIAYGPTADIAIRTRISKSIFLRPIVSFSYSNSLDKAGDETDAYSYDNTTYTISPGIDIIFSLSSDELLNNFNTYIGCGPRFSYTEVDYVYKATGLVSNGNFFYINRAIGGVAFFGTQYYFNSRFILLGETGFSYTHAYESQYNTEKYKVNALSTFVKVGIIFMF
jgi:hypothetical protein